MSETELIVSNRMQGVDCPYCEDNMPHVHSATGLCHEAMCRDEMVWHKAIEIAVSDEREACAKLCDEEILFRVREDPMDSFTAGEVYGFTMAAKVIRARKLGAKR